MCRWETDKIGKQCRFSSLSKSSVLEDQERHQEIYQVCLHSCKMLQEKLRGYFHASFSFVPTTTTKNCQLIQEILFLRKSLTACSFSMPLEQCVDSAVSLRLKRKTSKHSLRERSVRDCKTEWQDRRSLLACENHRSDCIQNQLTFTSKWVTFCYSDHI